MYLRGYRHFVADSFFSHFIQSCRQLFALSVEEGKIHHREGHEGPEGKWKYSYTLSLTSAIDSMGFERHTPAALPPEMRLVTIV
jgi:hypothetical protein